MLKAVYSVQSCVLLDKLFKLIVVVLKHCASSDILLRSLYAIVGPVRWHRS